MSPGRPIGRRVRQICQYLSEHGESTAQQIDTLCGVSPTNVHKYGQRAEAYGLVAVDRTVHPYKYSLLAGWEARLEIRVRRTIPPELGPIRNVKPLLPRVSSVWDLGAVL